jgi:hypothetical protein
MLDNALVSQKANRAEKDGDVGQMSGKIACPL